MLLETISSMPAEIVWAVLGLIFVFIEFFIPGLVIVFFGVGALITAITTWVGFTPSLPLQLLVFIVSSVLFLLLLRKYVKRTFLGKTLGDGDDDSLNFNIEIGKIVPVIEAIKPGEVGGKVKYQGTNWSARASERIKTGESVKITGCDNITLLVEKIKKGEEK